MALSSELVSSDRFKIFADLKIKLSLASGGFFLLGLLQVGLFAYWKYNSVFMCLLSLIIFGIVFITSIIVVPHYLKSSYVNSALALHFWATWSVGGIGLLLGQQVANHLTKDVINDTQNSALLGHATTEMIPLLFTGISIVIFIFAIPICTVLNRRSLQHDRQSHDQVNCHGQANSHDQESSHEQTGSHKTFCPKNWCLHLGSMGLIFAAMNLAALFGQWLFSGEGSNSLAEHYFNLTLLALFSTCIYHLLTKRVARMIDE